VASREEKQTEKDQKGERGNSEKNVKRGEESLLGQTCFSSLDEGEKPLTEVDRRGTFRRLSGTQGGP